MINSAVIFFLSFVVIILLFNSQKQFGKKASGINLQKIKNSTNFRKGKFTNLTPTPDFSEEANFFSLAKDIMFRRGKKIRPENHIPSIKTNLNTLDPKENVLVWFGHSSYFLQLDGKKILVDPVFSGAASPLPFFLTSFKGSDIYKAEEMPKIDYLIITHDHWDHLDYKTIKKLLPKVGMVISGLGTGTHLEYWGYNKEQIIQLDWHEKASLDLGFYIQSMPARHFSGRGLFDRKKTLWSSFILKTPSKKIYIGGDSGYDLHFKEIGQEHKHFDLAILECGQYNKLWKYLHMHPQEVLKAAQDLNAQILMPSHWGKFALSSHDWDEPIKKIYNLSKVHSVPLLTPLIGQKNNFNNLLEFNENWWEKIS